MAQAKISKGCFRVRVRESDIGEWVTTPVWEDGIGLSENKSEARIFQPNEQEYWQDEPDLYEMVMVQEDEIMATLGEEVAPRLPGF